MWSYLTFLIHLFLSLQITMRRKLTKEGMHRALKDFVAVKYSNIISGKRGRVDLGRGRKLNKRLETRRYCSQQGVRLMGEFTSLWETMVEGLALFLLLLLILQTPLHSRSWRLLRLMQVYLSTGRVFVFSWESQSVSQPWPWGRLRVTGLRHSLTHSLTRLHEMPLDNPD